MSILLETKSLSKYYKNNTFCALDNVSLKLEGNQVVGLIGSNGSGKTTFVKACTNLISYDGSISYNGNIINNQKDAHKYYSAVLEGNRNIYWKLTVMENIRFFAQIRGLSWSSVRYNAQSLVKDLFLEEKKDALVETLSRGMQQKTALICSLISNTPIIFLDEPTLGLDVESTEQLKYFFSKSDFIENKLIIITSHHLKFLESVTNRNFLMKKGRINELDIGKQSSNIFEIFIYCKSDNIEQLRTMPIHVTEEKIDTYKLICDISLIPLSVILKEIEVNNLEIINFNKLSHNLETLYLNSYESYKSNSN